ncbi:GSCOCG00003835001-RA-CDS, partial [Cotesia congregata]
MSLLLSFESTAANKTMTIDDVENDDHVNIIRALLLECMLEEASWTNYRESMEEGLQMKMTERNFSAFTEEFMKNITATRKAKCAPNANPNDYTPKPGYEFTVIATYQSPESNGQESSENGAENSHQGNEE